MLSGIIKPTRTGALLAGLLGGLLADVAVGADEPLHARIDRLIAGEDGPPAAPIADDAAFLRRIHLDFIGVIPSPADTRAFLADTSPDRRVALIDRLLDDPRYAQHVADVFDVMLMERLADKHVKQPQWRGYLVESMAANKPYDQMVREILSADGADAKSRDVAAFYLNREAEQHQLTRDIGRTFFGRDLQCAQCHDHPDITDFRQADYYGVFAFLNRTSLFTDPKSKQAMLAETANGEVTYQSVFTKASYGAQPRVFGGAPIAEPVLKGDEAYKVKPAKNVRSVPTFSRREQLAVEATKGDVEAFNRNIANRLWAHMLGRGLVHPVDMHHAANPPTHPQLLDLLSREFAAMKYDIRAMLRQIALSEAYQRSFEPPRDFGDRAQQFAQRLPKLEEARRAMASRVDDAHDRFDEADESVIKAAKGAATTRAAAAAAQKALAEAQKAADPANKALAEAQRALAGKRPAMQALADAAATAQQAATTLESDKTVKQAADILAARMKKLEGEMAAMEQAVKQREAAAKPLTEKLAAAEQAHDAAQEKDAAARQALDAAQQAQSGILAELTAHQSALAAAQREIELARALADLAIDGSEAQRSAAMSELLPHLSQSFDVRPLKPLSAEQLAMSMMQATGALDAQRAAAEAELRKARADAAAKATAEARKKDKDAPEVKPADVTPVQIEQALRKKVAGTIKQFVDLFAASPGQPQDAFFATVDQALFLSNGGVLDGWLNPAGDNLTARLVKLEDTKALAVEMYTSILSRTPTDNEASDVAQYLAGRKDDRAEAIKEMSWALLTSNEFRFCH